MGVMPSPITGSAGNIEFLLHARTPGRGPVGAIRAPGRRPRGPWSTPRWPKPTSTTGEVGPHGTDRLLHQPARPEATALAERAAAWLADQGHQVDLGPGAGRLGVGGRRRPAGQPGRRRHPAAVGRTPPWPAGIPVLGVNIGRLGYLTQVEPSGLEEALAAFLAGTHQVEERMTLSVDGVRARRCD